MIGPDDQQAGPVATEWAVRIERLNIRLRAGTLVRDVWRTGRWPFGLLGTVWPEIPEYHFRTGQAMTIPIPAWFCRATIWANEHGEDQRWPAMARDWAVGIGQLGRMTAVDQDRVHAGWMWDVVEHVAAKRGVVDTIHDAERDRPVIHVMREILIPRVSGVDHAGRNRRATLAKVVWTTHHERAELAKRHDMMALTYASKPAASFDSARNAADNAADNAEEVDRLFGKLFGRIESIAKCS